MKYSRILSGGCQQKSTRIIKSETRGVYAVFFGSRGLWLCYITATVSSKKLRSRADPFSFGAQFIFALTSCGLGSLLSVMPRGQKKTRLSKLKAIWPLVGYGGREERKKVAGGHTKNYHGLARFTGPIKNRRSKLITNSCVCSV